MLQRLYYSQDASPVWRAAYNGDADEVEQLLSSGADCCNIDPEGRCTPLQIAAWRGNTGVVRVLLANAGNYTTTAGVFFCPDVHIADREGHYPLHYAMRGLHIEIVRLLIAYGANVNLNIAVQFADCSSCTSAPVSWAADSKLLSEEHPCRGHNGSTTSAEWAQRRLEMMRLLFSHGTEVPAPESPCGKITIWENAVGYNLYGEGDTPDTRMLELLIEYDTPRVASIDGWTVAHMICGMNYWERRHGHDLAMLAVLVAHGYNLQGNHGARRTPLHMAACGGNRDVVQFLLDSGVDLEGEDFMNAAHFGGGGECWDLIVRAHYRARRDAFALLSGLPVEMVEFVFGYIDLYHFL